MESNFERHNTLTGLSILLITVGIISLYLGTQRDFWVFNAIGVLDMGLGITLLIASRRKMW